MQAGRQGGRRAGAAALIGAIALTLLVAAIAGSASGQPVLGEGCAGPSPSAAAQQMRKYKDAGTYPVNVTGEGVFVEVPPIDFSGAGESSTLPIGPCQHIYRFRYRSIDVPVSASPFRYVEIDWNTEGEPRGPNESFVSPHFDFHFYLRPRKQVDAMTMCPSSNGRTCDPLRTGYEQMRRFMRLPPPAYIPAGYRPDVGSSIPKMGLHLLDSRFHYNVHSVDHHPTLLYGTFDGKVLFAEASVTLATLHDVVVAPHHAISYPYRQPAKVRGGIRWPTRFTIQYLPETGAFRAGFDGLRRR